MDVFKKVAVVRNGGIVETLHWDGGEGFMLVGEFAALSQRTEAEKTRAEAQRDLKTWAELMGAEDDFEVVEADHEALDEIMEGQEWPTLRTR